MELSVIIPIFNEEESLEPLIEEIEEVLIPLNKTYEIIAIDDGSIDKSRKILRELVQKHSKLKAIFFRRNFGQTAAFDAGFRHANGEIVITMDADLQNDPHDIPKMLQKLEQGYDFVSGWRRNRQDDFITRKIPSLLGNWLIRKITHTQVKDLGCSLKVYRREITNDMRLYGEMHRFIAILAEGMGAKVADFEVNHRARKFGQTKYGLGRTFKVLLDLITVWFMRSYHTKPIYIFGGAGLILLFLAALLSGYVLWEKYVYLIWVHKNPLFLVSIMFALMGIQFLAMGLIAEIIVRTYFESQDKCAYSIEEILNTPEKTCAE